MSHLAIYVRFTLCNPNRSFPRIAARGNPPNRFEKIHLERDEDWNPEEDPLPRTQFLKDSSKTIIAYNDSPDIGFEASVKSVSWLRAWLYLLLRATVPRISRLFLGPRFRDQNHG